MFESLINNLKDEPFVIKDFLPNPEKYLSWDDIDRSLKNNYIQWEILDPSPSRHRIPIPSSRYEYFRYPVQDHHVIKQFIDQGLGFIMLEYSYSKEIVNDLCKQIQEKFMVTTDVHVFGGKTAESHSLNMHADLATNIIIPTYGKIKWKIYNNRLSTLHDLDKIQEEKPWLEDPSLLDIKFEVVLEAGDLLYLPARVYHEAIPLGKRLSMSIPCWSVLNESQKIPR
jgi:hypothetical protein